MTTLMQERLAEKLEDPTIKTKTAAILAAGYSESTARTQQGRQSSLVGVKRARRAIEEERRDSARTIHELSGAQVVERMPEMPDMAVIAAWKTSADIIAAGAGTEETDTARYPRSWYRAQRRRWMIAYANACVKAARCPIDSDYVKSPQMRLSPPDVDASAINADAVSDTVASSGE